MWAGFAFVHQVLKSNIEAVVLVLSWGKLVSHAAYRKKKAKLYRRSVKGLGEVETSYAKVVEEGVQGCFYLVVTGLGEGRGVAIG